MITVRFGLMENVIEIEHVSNDLMCHKDCLYIVKDKKEIYTP